MTINQSLKFDKELDASRNCLNFFKNSKYITDDQFNMQVSNNQLDNNFSILHINARSLQKNLDGILILLW